VAEYVGGYDDWLRQRPSASTPVDANATRKPEPVRPTKTVKRSFKEQREMESLPKTIEALEAEQRDLHARMAEADFYRQDSAVINAAQARLEELEKTLEANYRRWEALES